MADNASSNVAMTRHLSLVLARDGIIWDNQTHYILCFAHIINLIVQQFI